MRYTRVYIDAVQIELPEDAVAMRVHENQLAPLLAQLRIPVGTFEAMTGIKERRFWPEGVSLAKEATKAARKALAVSSIDASELGAVVYTSVCREHMEPATACLIAGALEVPSTALVYDLSNACLGALNGIVELANHIELGHFRAGLVVCCESSRPVIEETIAALLRGDHPAALMDSVATLTGGSGAAAILVTDGSFPGGARHRLLGATARSASQHHELCRWSWHEHEGGLYRQSLKTLAKDVLQYGLELGQETWRAFLTELDWEPAMVDRTITHQVSRSHRQQMLTSLELSFANDYATFYSLGNIGSVSVPLTAALAEQDGFLQTGQRTAWLGIGSGLNCLMLGLQW